MVSVRATLPGGFDAVLGVERVDRHAGQLVVGVHDDHAGRVGEGTVEGTRDGGRIQRRQPRRTIHIVADLDPKALRTDERNEIRVDADAGRSVVGPDVDVERREERQLIADPAEHVAGIGAEPAGVQSARVQPAGVQRRFERRYGEQTAERRRDA